MNRWKQFGFTVVKTTPLPELEAVLYRMEHDKTGLELVWLKRDEENKTFGIAFQTLPWDDTGVFHILEHSVLCGSEKYPVKEPFVELMKSSMNTFLNALTFQDKTFYPISSRNDKDFINLMRVYMDAVLRPLIYTKPEIFYQEGWHYEQDENGNIGYKGVVFNEMKGAFAGADELAVDRLNRLLFPDSPYRFVSGGDPASIPNLSYETFLDTHARFYAPSNAYIFLDGDMDIEQVLGILNDEYLCHYEKTERMAPPQMQAPVCGRDEGYYELAEGEPLEGKARLSFGKVIGTFDEREKIVAMQVLSEVLCGSNQSPLSKAILRQGLAEEVDMGVNDGMLQPWLMLEVKNLRAEDAPKVEAAICAQLEELACNGLDRGQLEAVLANVEFKMRERDYGYYPQGIIFGFTALETWLYGGDPAADLEVGELFVKLRQKMNEGYFEQLIRTQLLQNPHSATMLLRPSHSAGEERRAAERARLERESAAWTRAQREQMAARQEMLLRWQESADAPETLATIPQLSLADIPTQPEQIPTQVARIADITLLKHALHTGGIAYVTLYFDADGCDEQALSMLAFACGLLGQSETQKHSAEQIVNKTRLLCGNFGVCPATYIVGNDPKNVTTKLCVSFSTLRQNLDEATAHVLEILTQSRFDEENALDDLRQIKMDVFQRAVMAGNSVALGRVLGQFSAAGVAEDNIGGVGYYQWLQKTEQAWDFAALNEKMQALLGGIVNRKTLTLSVSGVEDPLAERLAQTLADALPEKTPMPRKPLRPWGKRKEGICVPTDISFAVLGGNYAESGAYCGQMQLAAQVLSLAYLWNVIRVQGGAYGTGMLMRTNGLAACYSYRDPQGAASVERYRACAQFLREFVRQQTDFTGFIIGAVAGASALMTPRTKAAAGDNLYFTQTTWEQRCENRHALLNATAQDLLAVADLLEKTMNDGGVCIVGGREQLERCTELENVIVL